MCNNILLSINGILAIPITVFTDSGGCWNGWIVSETVNTCPRYTCGIATLVDH